MIAKSDSCRSTPYWRSNLRLVGILLAIWALVTFLPAYYALSFSDLTFLEWPFPFWAAAFGAPSAFLILVGVYAWKMECVDQQRRAAQAAEN